MKKGKIILILVFLFVVIVSIVFIFKNNNISQKAESLFGSTLKDNISLLSTEVKKQSVNSLTQKGLKKEVNVTKQSTFSYKVKKGDCLWKIAKKMYGNGNLWILIFDKNKEILKNPDLLYANIDIVMPDLNNYKKSDVKNIQNDFVISSNNVKHNANIHTKSVIKISDLDNKKLAEIYKSIYNSYKKSESNVNAFDYLIVAKKIDPDIFKNDNKELI